MKSLKYSSSNRMKKQR